MNVLHFTNKPIFPLLDGGRLATHNLLLNLLDLGFNVKNLTVETFKHPFLPETFDQEILKTINTESVFIKTKINFWKAFVSMLKKQSYNVIRFQNLELENKISKLCQASKSSHHLQTTRSPSQVPGIFCRWVARLMII